MQDCPQNEAIQNGSKLILFRMGSGLRAQSARSFTPGPGSYEATQYIGKAPKYSIALKTSYMDPTKMICSPGPCNYSPNTRAFYKNISHTMSAKLNQTKSDLTPGPGNYEVRSEKSLQVPTYKFGREIKCQIENTTARQTPGPGNYETRKNLGDNAPKISFGKEMRGDRGRPMTPGPGQYDIKKLIGNDGPKIHISSVRPDTATTQKWVPGPGQYDANLSNRPKTPSYKIGTSQRDGFKTTGVPGPGQYELNSSTSLSVRPKSPHWKMGTSERGPLSTCERTPGPGNYNISSSVGKAPKVAYY
jgi:hypothetical protein